jgi:hypothetical protein
MLSHLFRLAPGLALFGLLALSPPGPVEPQIDDRAVTSETDALTVARVEEAFGNLPLYFIENQGQLDARVAYYLQGRESVYFSSEGVTIALTGPAVPAPGPDADETRTLAERMSLRSPAEPDGARQRWAVKLDFVGASPGVRPNAEDPTPAVVSYFKGPREQWKTGVKTYSSLVYRDLWPGIDLVFAGSGSRLKYTFLVGPGADPERIQLAYRGATAVRLTGAGELDISTPAGDFRDEKPYAYQDIEGRRVEVEAAYALNPEAPTEAQGFRFSLGAYDRGKPLVLDPATLVYAGYIGGLNTDSGFGIAVDSAQNAYVTGYTTSSEATFPVTVGPDLTTNGSYDAFVAKVNLAGTALVYAGYIGGAADDMGFGIAVDSRGNAYVTGSTDSKTGTFPVMVGPDLSFNGNLDAFVAKVNVAGTVLVYAGYVGGTGVDSGRGIAVDGRGNAYVTGSTDSVEATFPVTVGPDLTFNGGDSDAFVAKVSAAGTALVYAGYVGGASEDRGTGSAVDSLGNAYITGSTASERTFPVTMGPDLTHNGGFDGFVAKVNGAGSALVYAGYIGGASQDESRDIAVDSEGNAYVAGATFSTEATFPVMVGPDLTYNGGGDAFVAKVNSAQAALVYAGYIGGTEIDWGDGVAVDGLGNAYITGYTGSESMFPVTMGPDLTFNGGAWDAFVAEVNSLGTALVYAGYIGGNDTDWGQGIAVNSVGNAYVTGFTMSTEETFPVTVGPDLTFNSGSVDGFNDAFVAKISAVIQCPFQIALRGDPAQRARLGTVYRFRDEVMTQSPEGKRYIVLFYRHAWEGSRLLAEHPDLAVKTRAVLDRLLPKVQAVVAGQPAQLSSAEVASIEQLMKAFAAKASPALRRTIRQLRAELRSGRFRELLLE